MIRYSRRKLARTFVKMLAQQSNTQAIRVLARELVATHRLHDIDLLIKDMEQEQFRATGELTVTVTSARPLSQASADTITDFLEKKTDAKKVIANFIVDPKIKGGIILESADWHLDLSVKRRLQQLEASYA